MKKKQVKGTVMQKTVCKQWVERKCRAHTVDIPCWQHGPTQESSFQQPHAWLSSARLSSSPSDHTDTQLFNFWSLKSGKQLEFATGGKHRLCTFDNFPPRFPFWDRLCLRRQPQVVKKAKAAQLQPMGRPRGLNDPSLKHAAGLDTTGGVHMAGCVYSSGLTKTASERGSFWRALPTEQDYSEVCPEVREQGGK